jgi:acetylglutamate kinase
MNTAPCYMHEAFKKNERTRDSKKTDERTRDSMRRTLMGYLSNNLVRRIQEHVTQRTA